VVAADGSVPVEVLGCGDVPVAADVVDTAIITAGTVCVIDAGTTGRASSVNIAEAAAAAGAGVGAASVRTAIDGVGLCSVGSGVVEGAVVGAAGIVGETGPAWDSAPGDVD
jgi:hypothetical protein